MSVPEGQYVPLGEPIEIYLEYNKDMFNFKLIW